MFTAIGFIFEVYYIDNNKGLVTNEIMCHGFRLMKRDDDFWDDFDHF